ncbi:MAG: asparagine synthase (glutamine-hydrolyzing) [Pseudomonadota bacterium]
MCGIAGFLDAKGATRAEPERIGILQRMGRQLARRGPDDESLYCDDALSLAFRRLSIVDVDNGRQPFRNADGTLLAVVNGEIYNHRELREGLKREHRFRTRSDCEIVLHLYEELGVEAFSRLNGIFAACIWDVRERRLVLARDHLGVKPMFFSDGPDGFLFASEIKALRAHPGCSTEPGWDDFHLGGPRDGMHDPRYALRLPTYVENVDTLPGGHYMTVQDGRRSGPTPYWRIEDARVDVPGRASAICERYADLLEDAVRMQLMSDVPLGVFLSGGLDSCAIAAIASRHRPDIHCLNIVEETVEASGDAAAARELAAHLGLRLSQVRFRADHFLARQPLGLAELEYFVWMLDMPFLDPEIFFKHEAHRFLKTDDPELKVVLLGQGADEFAGGYSNSYADPQPSWDRYLRMQRMAGFASPYRDWMSVDRLRERDLPSYRTVMRTFVGSLQRYNLWHEDRTSASQGVESRVPFLDRRLVEFLWSIPEPFHRELFWDKEIVRRAAARWVPEPLCRRRKVPFFQGRDMSSVTTMFFVLFRNAWPAFVEKYIDAPDNQFDGQALSRLAERAASDPAALIALFRAMALAIFSRQGRDAGRDHYPDFMTPPSPLAETG